LISPRISPCDYVPLFIRLFPDPEKRPRHGEIFLEHFRKGKITEAVRAFRKEYWKQTRSVIDHVSSSKRAAARSRQDAVFSECS
jgi:hypothetical protein